MGPGPLFYLVFFFFFLGGGFGMGQFSKLGSLFGILLIRVP